MAAKEPELFKTKIVQAKNGSGKLFEEVFEKNEGPITCLGMTFQNDDARRAYFTDKLREKLKDPEFRKIEGFPIGKDEDILALSDPPYYTACPNPWLKDFIEQWESQKPAMSDDYQYHREPFATDVSEGKNDPIYNAHSYHTKVPHKAIMRYILHYTDPGDIVFDGFCGTGMTGVAAQMCGDRGTIESLGYQVKPDGTILQQEETEDGKKTWVPFSKLGERKVVLNDLSPAATFISYNYNTPIDANTFQREAIRILKKVENECGWMYETVHIDGKTKGRINYTIWSDVFICNNCIGEVVFWKAAVNKELGEVRESFPCPHCKANLTKRSMERAWIIKYDSSLGESIKQAKQVPVLINFSIAGNKRRIEKIPDNYDLELIEKIENSQILYWHPCDRMMNGKESRRNDKEGITNVHHFYSKRNLIVFSNAFAKYGLRFKWIVTGCLQRGSKQHQIAITRIGGEKAGVGGATAGHRRGTLYIPSNQVEMNPFNLIKDRITAMKKASVSLIQNGCLHSTMSTSAITGQLANSIDYFFFDPPFGSNIAYSELNSLQEYWLSVKTNQTPEAIEDKGQNKSLRAYSILITNCFKTAYKILKPGRWMTVEFSNTKASVWNIIQSSLQEVGFIISNVSALDKKRGGLNAIVGITAVKQDLIISAYKPNGGFEKRFIAEADSKEGVWDFVRTHLKYLPVIKKLKQDFIVIPERDPRILFDQVVAYYVRKGFHVPISSKEFQIGLGQKFPERDGMYFMPDQVAEYDKKKMAGSGKYKQIEIFVSDEASAIEWLRALLKEKPQSTQDIHPQFIQETQRSWKKNEQQVEMSALLDLNFLCYDGKSRVPAQIHSYLSTNFKDMRNLEKDDPILMAKAKNRWYAPDPNEAEDREKVREKSLLKDFEQYRQTTKKLKVFRLEAVRAGFKKAYLEKNYQIIIDVAQKIPSSILEEDPKLLLWYDQAVTRMGGE